MNHDTTHGRRIDERTDQKQFPRETDAADHRETPPASSWSVDRRTFVKAGTLLGLTGGALGGVSASAVAQATDPWSQQAKLLASDGTADDEFGYSVSIARDGNTALVGAYLDDNDNEAASGSVYVFTRAGGTWSQQQKLTANDADRYDRFGYSVSIDKDGDTALVGAPRDEDNGYESGSVYVFTQLGGTWTQQAKLTASDGDGVDYEQLGLSMSISGNGDTALIGTFFNSVYVFTRSGNTWSQQAKLTANDAGLYDGFGYSVSIGGDGNTAFIGAPQDTTDNGHGHSSGSAYVFTRSGSAWTQQQKLTASDQEDYEHFGSSVAIAGDSDIALIGAPGDHTDNGYGSGSAYVFTHAGGTWTQKAKLTANDGASYDHFGESISIDKDGDTALVGAYLDDNDNEDNSGSAYVFTQSGSAWTQQQKLTANDAAANDQFGWSVSIAGSGDTSLVGVWEDDPIGGDGSSSGPGSAYVFTRQSSNQPQEKTLRIEGTGEYAFYAFTASGDVTLTEGDKEDEIDGSTVHGAVGPQSDTYTFTGSLESFYLSAAAVVSVDGEQIDPSTYPSAQHTIKFEGKGSYSTYEFSVSETIVDSRGLDREDTISGNHAEGAVGAGQELYVYTGDLTNLDTTGDVRVIKADMVSGTGDRIVTTNEEEIQEDDI